MKRAICLLLFLLPRILVAQEGEEISVNAALESTGRATQWQNWVFAGGIIAAAAIGITFIALNEGSHEH